MADKERKPDRRVIKTKRAIRNAFAKLLCEKDIDKITIKDIADTADINRKTFYNYYSGVYQIIDEIENEVVENLNQAIADIDYNDYLQNPNTIFSKLTETINKDIDFYGYLLSMNSNVSLFSKIVDLLKKKTSETILSRVDADEERLSIIIEYTISGMISAYKSWFNSGSKLTIEDVSDILCKLLCEGSIPIIQEYSPDFAQ